MKSRKVIKHTWKSLKDPKRLLADRYAQLHANRKDEGRRSENGDNLSVKHE